MTTLLNVAIISSKTGGTPGETDAYNRETTIRRIQEAVEAIVSEHVPRGQISTVKIQVKKPAGAIRRLVRGERGVQTTSIQFRIALGGVTDMDRGGTIRACQAAVPKFVMENVPADHLCSLVIGVKAAAAR